MNLTLSNLKPAKGSTKRRKRVGRGGKRGTYSGKGLKGQKARSGVSGLKALGFKQTLQRTPKLRGFKSLKAKMAIVNLSDLDKLFKDGDKIAPKDLIKAGLIESAKSGVKVLGFGQLSKKLEVTVNAFSNSAKEAIEKAGGKAEIIVK
ncbi:50S ribosomal protein L15 [Candidatus Falkowbacteria bacterium]|uniref:Large ribosomal subunit protein uL15 n=1 Tax=Candidatus Buchananbacteria bacterium CG10_big_fil_rev_8_21_14_0_10_33_19 TaxID=1974525 RepID=A0A2H0W305_9BACT|nr:50S ribosomal protein L15 [Candidatus Falkowbacteria bacterium]PIS05742.1 MAG: 50S ribosomal protein L15 [Candidatus Buchananbacteria bacterium CG10_big_fil_rev_8_21_14_0_10_33_19]